MYAYQTITSKETSIKQVPALHKSRYVAEIGRNASVLDYGAGKYPELAETYLRNNVAISEYTPYDPYNLPGKLIPENARYDITLCANVLNVIREPEAITGVIRNAIFHTKLHGVALFAVYEGDKTGQGRITSKGYQRNERTERYITYILSACPWIRIERKGKIIIAHV